MSIEKINIFYNRPHQIIDFLGASQAAWSDELYSNSISDSVREEVFDRLFSDNEDCIKLSVLRCEISYDYYPEPGVYDFNAWPDQTKVMKEAKRRGVKKFISTAWTPPAWMKSNGQLNKGHLLEEYYDEYADFLAQYVAAFESMDLHIDAISVSNEPQGASTVSWPSCSWSGEQLHKFHLEHLKPCWERYGLTGKVKIIVGEPFGWNENVLLKTLNDTKLTDYIDVVAAHNYPIPFIGGKFPQIPLPKATELNKKVWMTEVSTVGKYDKTMTSGLFYAKEMHTFFTTVRANAYLYWVGAYAGTSGRGSDESLLSIVENNGVKVCEATKRFYCFGNYSKFIEPNGFRIESSVTRFDDVYVCAFKNDKDDELSIIITNDSDLEVSVELNIENKDAINTLLAYLTDDSHDLEYVDDIHKDNGVFRVTLPSKSVSTFSNKIFE